MLSVNKCNKKCFIVRILFESDVQKFFSFSSWLYWYTSHNWEFHLFKTHNSVVVRPYTEPVFTSENNFVTSCSPTNNYLLPHFLYTERCHGIMVLVLGKAARTWAPFHLRDAPVTLWASVFSQVKWRCMQSVDLQTFKNFTENTY